STSAAGVIEPDGAAEVPPDGAAEIVLDAAADGLAAGTLGLLPPAEHAARTRDRTASPAQRRADGSEGARRAIAVIGRKDPRDGVPAPRAALRVAAPGVRATAAASPRAASTAGFGLGTEWRRQCSSRYVTCSGCTPARTVADVTSEGQGALYSLGKVPCM